MERLDRGESRDKMVEFMQLLSCKATFQSSLLQSIHINY